MPVQRVAIIGLGLIGASLGLALHRLTPAPRVVGYDRSGDARTRAARRHAVDRTPWSLEETVEGADLVVLATPVRAVAPLLGTIAPYLAPGAVVTDTGSTKEQVMLSAAEVAPQVAFVGGHPMAGKLTHGSADADAALFDGTVYCLTPTADTPPAAIQRVTELVEAVGARPHFLDAAEHDGLVAAISHLPYLLASTLMTAASADPGWREMAALAAGGFSTMTRLVEGEPEMYADICLTNREAIARQLDRYMEALGSLRAAVAAGDEGLRARFAAAREQHQAWLAQRATPPEGTALTPEVRAHNPFIPQSWQDALRGRRPERKERGE
ncbi:MAG TPA: prephenate dehydrogenase [Chloroflexota bacterium]|nr:prephenate dehydrogenase [Chloroflexota bacterium]